jgi:dethiobiotin synthetase
MSVAARKPAQSFVPGDDPQRRDAAVLGSASGEPPESVCPPHRWYEVPMAPPMAAAALGRPAFAIADLVDELALSWPPKPAEVGLVETAGGVRSPIASDGDCLHLCQALGPDLIVLVADAGLGTINAVRLSSDALGAVVAALVVVLNRFDPTEDVHVENAEWLRSRDRLTVVEMPGGARELSALVSS